MGFELPIRSIVFATDFLENSRLALDYAVAFSHHFSATLTIVHVFELSNEAEQAELLSHRSSVSREFASARLQALSERVRRFGVNAEVDLREGDPYAQILSSAVENKADLLVLGTHGIYRGLEHLLIGSNAEKVLLASQCPTVTVGQHVLAGIDLDLQFSKILCISDLSPESVSAAHYAILLAQDLGIRAEFLGIVPDNLSPDSPSVRLEVERFCTDLAAKFAASRHEWCNSEFHFSKIASTEEALRIATASPDILLIFGVHSESRWNRHFHTSFAYNLAATACSPLLSILNPGCNSVTPPSAPTRIQP